MMVTLGMGEVFTVGFVADEVVGVRGCSSGVVGVLGVVPAIHYSTVQYSTVQCNCSI